MFGLFAKLGHGNDELARRLGLSPLELASVKPRYHRFSIPKRAGGTRTIHAPEDKLKSLQRRINRRILALLVCHQAACGFERSRSVVTHCLPHAGKSIVVRMDLKYFFSSTAEKRVERFFFKIGWNKRTARLLTHLCTFHNGLPQGAPTSPRLSNLVNYRLDARLDGLAKKLGASYTRYADDLTFSFDVDDSRAIHGLVRLAKVIVEDEGYRLHMKKKLHIRRRHQQQRVTGLVLNDRVNLPRQTRRWLRAVEHHVATGRQLSLTQAQLEGWRAYRSMIALQTS